MKFLFVVLFIAVSVILFVIKISMKKNKYNKMSDQELIREFEKCVDEITLIKETCNGLKGLGSTMATNKANDDIEKWRENGEIIGEILVSRGYTVNFKVLNGMVSKSSSGQKSVIGSAIAGGIIAGGPGAVVGAISAMDKNNRNNQK